MLNKYDFPLDQKAETSASDLKMCEISFSIYHFFKSYFSRLTSRLKTGPDIKDFEISCTGENLVNFLRP